MIPAVLILALLAFIVICMVLYVILWDDYWR